MKSSRIVKLRDAEHPISRSPVKRRAALAKLRAKPQIKMRVHQLPFVGRDHENKNDGTICFWDIPMKGGYGGGCTTGKEVARMYLAYLREIYSSSHEEAESMFTANLLNIILFDMINKNPADRDEQDSIRGQIVGFAHEINLTLRRAALAGLEAERFDNFDWKASIDAANKGLTSERPKVAKSPTKPAVQHASKSA
jgi:hypothetical protein